MQRIALVVLVVAIGSSAQAGKGIGSAIIYGPYRGGHAYSYNVAYSYGLSFTAADSWRRDPFAYPAGIYPYRPDGKPIYHRAFPLREGQPEPISVIGEDGLPVLVHPGGCVAGCGQPLAVGSAAPVAPEALTLQPVPQQTHQQAAVAGEQIRSGAIKISAPPGAEVWVEGQPVSGGAERLATVVTAEAGKLYVLVVRATWVENGRSFDQMRAVGIKAGETAKVSFPGRE